MTRGAGTNQLERGGEERRAGCSATRRPTRRGRTRFPPIDTKYGRPFAVARAEDLVHRCPRGPGRAPRDRRELRRGLHAQRLTSASSDGSSGSPAPRVSSQAAKANAAASSNRDPTLRCRMPRPGGGRPVRKIRTVGSGRLARAGFRALCHTQGTLARGGPPPFRRASRSAIAPPPFVAMRLVRRAAKSARPRTRLSGAVTGTHQGFSRSDGRDLAPKGMRPSELPGKEAGRPRGPRSRHGPGKLRQRSKSPVRPEEDVDLVVQGAVVIRKVLREGRSPLRAADRGAGPVGPTTTFAGGASPRGFHTTSVLHSGYLEREQLGPAAVGRRAPYRTPCGRRARGERERKTWPTGRCRPSDAFRAARSQLRVC